MLDMINYTISKNTIVAEIEVSQRCALPKHFCKALCPGWADGIGAEIEVNQRSALCQHSCKALCPSIADQIGTEIEVSERCALPQHSCKTFCPTLADIIEAEIEVSQRCSLLHCCKPPARIGIVNRLRSYRGGHDFVTKDLC